MTSKHISDTETAEALPICASTRQRNHGAILQARAISESQEARGEQALPPRNVGAERGVRPPRSLGPSESCCHRNSPTKILPNSFLSVIVLLASFALAFQALGLTNPGYEGLSYPERTTMDSETLSAIRVNTNSGDVILQRMIFEIPGKGVPVEIYLTYNSDHRLISSPFGFGWNLSYNIRYTEDSANNVTIVWGDGRQDTFTWAGGAYTPPPGIHAALAEDGSGKLTLTSKRGMKFIFSEAAHRKLTAVEDPNGNALAVNYDAEYRLMSIVDASARQYNFNYGANGKLAQIEDTSLTRSYTLAFDADGRLTSITDPSGNAETFSYDSENLLTGMTDKVGNTTAIAYQTPAWDSETRLPQSIDRGGSAFTFSFNKATSTTIVTDPSGNAWRYVYGSPIEKIIDPPGNETSLTWDNDKNILSITDRNGNTTAFTHDGKGNPLTRTDALGNTSSWTYEPNFNAVTSFTDAKGKAWRYHYDAKGNLTGATDPVGNAITTTFDSSGQMVSDTDRNGNTATLAYDANGNVTTITNALGNQTHLTYDAGSRFTQVTDDNGNSAAVSYDALDRLISVTDPLGNADNYAYDDNGNLTSYTDRRGSATVYAYDALGRLSSVTDALGNADNRAYDANGNIVAYTDRRGNDWTMAYNALNRLTSRSDPLGGVWQFAYDAKGNLTQTTDANGNISSFSYDAVGRLASVTDALGNADNRAYDANGNMVAYTDRRGNQWTRSFDPLNRLTSWSDPLGDAWRLAYDARGNITQTTDANGNATAMAYDALDRLTSVTDALGNADSRAYDANGNLISYTNREGNATGYAYDALSRTTSISDALGNADARAYDANGNMIVYTDRRGNDWTRTYDALDRIVSASDPLGNVWRYSYDAEGNLVASSDAKGRTTTNTYDAANRLISQAFGGGESVAAKGETHKGERSHALTDSNTATFTYDGNGNLLTARDANSHYAFAYDPLDRKTQYTDNLLGKSVLYSYGPDGLLTSKTGPEGDVVSYAYDAAGRLATLTEPAGATSFSYDAAGNRLTANYPSGVKSSFTYDATNRVAAIVHKGPDDAVLASFAYTRYKMGRIVRSDLENGKYNRFFYDALGRIIEDDEISLFNDGAPVWAIENYTYDANGNKTNYTQSAINGVITWDAANRPIADTGWGNSGTTYTHDANGSRTQLKANDPNGVTRDYVYDNRNRMVSVHAQAPWLDQTYTYTYDVFNRLTKVDDGQGNIRRIMYGSPDPIAEYDGDGNPAVKYSYPPPLGPFGHLDLFMRMAQSAWGHAFVLYLRFGWILERHETGSRVYLPGEEPEQAANAAPKRISPMNWVPIFVGLLGLPPPAAGSGPKSITVPKTNPDNTTGIDKIYDALKGGNANDGIGKYVDDLFPSKPSKNAGGSRALTDQTGKKAADMPHNSRGEMDSFNPDILWPSEASAWIRGWWNGRPGAFDAVWPTRGHVYPEGSFVDLWDGGKINGPGNGAPAPLKLRPITAAEYRASRKKPSKQHPLRQMSRRHYNFYLAFYRKQYAMMRDIVRAMPLPIPGVVQDAVRRAQQAAFQQMDKKARQFLWSLLSRRGLLIGRALHPRFFTPAPDDATPSLPPDDFLKRGKQVEPKDYLGDLRKDLPKKKGQFKKGELRDIIL